MAVGKLSAWCSVPMPCVNSLESRCSVFIALGGVYGFWLIRAELATAQQLAQDMFEASRELEFDLIRASAHLCLGNVLLLRGDFVSAREHLQRSFELYDPDQARLVNALADPGVTCLVTQISVLWHLGYARAGMGASQGC